jgi:hypothetical protein
MPNSTSDPDEFGEEEVLSESTSEDARRVRVYDRKGDFLIDVPAGAKITFGYFNPSQSGGGVGRGNTWDDGNRNVAKQTALRIYERGEKGNQLACFIGVNGFRDESIKLVRLSQRVVIETNLNDDGEGNIERQFKQQRQLVASPEPDTSS